MINELLYIFMLFLPSVLAGVLVVSTHIPLGREVLSRGIIFMDLAIAQVAALGVIFATEIGLEPKGWGLQLLAVTSALLGALLLYKLEQYFAEVQEAVIGALFVLAASASLILLAHDPHGAEQMKDLLSGQVLWVGYKQLVPVAVLYLVVLALWFGPWWPPSRVRFYLLFALSITASLQLVGVYLVFATLILPALAVRRLSGKLALVLAYGMGAGAYILGLMASAVFDLPAGPLIVWALALCAIVVMVLSRRQAQAPG